jgi:hypothetical protein
MTSGSVMGMSYADGAGARVRPCLIHSMGKVGSTSLRVGLDSLGSLFVLQTHRLNRQTVPLRPYGLSGDVPGHVYNSILVRMGWLDRGLPVTCLTGMREPVGRNASEFFERNRRRIADMLDEGTARVDLLFSEFRDGFNHDEVDEWFDRELNDVFGIDVFAAPFDPIRGYGRITASDGSEILLYRADLSDAEKAVAIRGFLGVAADGLTVPRINTTESRDASQIYKEFLDVVANDVGYIRRMLNSRMARHFFSDGERDRLLIGWRSRTS